MFNIRVRIREHERGLRFRHGNFRELLRPGAHWNLASDVIQIVDTLLFDFEHALEDVLLKHASLREALTVVELADHERALVWKDGRLARLLGPGRHAFWNEPFAIEVETFDVNEVRFEHPRVETVANFAGSSRCFDAFRVAAHEQALVFRDGALIDALGAGFYVYWKNAGTITWKTIDLREQTIDVIGQDIMTRDKVTLRVNLLVSYQVIDAKLAIEVVSDFAQTLYRDAQLALRAAVGTRTLDALLTDKESVGGEVRDVLTHRAAEYGVSVRSVGLRDIILPGDMKTIMNQVIEAEKQAQANLIRRREETAAARSQANTAKLLAENPALARMKELEALQEILRGSKTTFVLGQGDLIDQVSSLTASRGD